MPWKRKAGKMLRNIIFKTRSASQREASSFPRELPRTFAERAGDHANSLRMVIKISSLALGEEKREKNMLVIRFLRVGKKNQPAFKIVVTDKRNPPRGGRFLEQVGFYNPLTKEKNLKIERIKYWLSVGAKPSDTVYNLLISEKIIEGKKIPLHKVKKKEEKSVSEKQEEKIEESSSAETSEGKEKSEEKSEESTS